MEQRFEGLPAPRDVGAADTRAAGAELRTAARVLFADASRLAREELAILKLEARAAGKRAATAWLFPVLAVLSCGALGVLGVLFSGAGAAVLASELLERPWAGPLVVGVVFLLVSAIGLALALRERRRVS